MSKVQNYRGYAAAIEFDAEDELFTGRIAGIADIIGFHADNVAGIKAAFHDAVDDYLALCAQTGKPAENFAPPR
jgi:predicted HicB family RNase H-like nuclease